MTDSLIIAGKSYASRLLVGTGKYKDFTETRAALDASGTEIVTVAIRRTNLGQNPNEPSLLADFAASLTTASKEELQSVMDAFNLRRRMEKVLVLIKKELEVAKLQSQIREQVEQKMSKQQREFFLREQLKEIQKELGLAKDDRTKEHGNVRPKHIATSGGLKKSN